MALLRGLEIPKLVGYFVDDSSVPVGPLIGKMGQNAFAQRPTEDMAERARSIAAAYKANGAKGGRPRKSFAFNG